MFLFYAYSSTTETQPLIDPAPPPLVYVITHSPLNTSPENDLEKAFIIYKKAYDRAEASLSSTPWFVLFGSNITLFFISIFLSDKFFPESLYTTLTRKHFSECLSLTLLIPLCVMALSWEILEHRCNKAKINLEKTMELFILQTRDLEKLCNIGSRMLGEENFQKIYGPQLEIITS